MQQNNTDIFSGAGKNVFLKKKPLKLHMAPMVDVIFLLLCFFILTAKFRKPEDFLNLKNTRQNSTQAISIIEPLKIDILSDGQKCLITIADSPTVTITPDRIEQGLADFIENFRTVLNSLKRLPSDPVTIHCDDQVQWDYLVKTYNIMHVMGVNNIEFDLTDQQ